MNMENENNKPLIVPEDYDSITEAIIGEYDIYPIDVDGDQWQHFVYLYEGDAKELPANNGTIIFDGKEYLICRNIYPLIEDGHFSGPRRSWLYDTEGMCVMDGENSGPYMEAADYLDPNHEGWAGLPGQHPRRWWAAMRDIGVKFGGPCEVMGVDAEDHEDVLIVSVERHGYSEIVAIVPMEGLEKVDGDVERDGDWLVYSDGEKYYRKSSSRWQGSPDYTAEVVTRMPCGAWAGEDENHECYEEKECPGYVEY